jgi:hypothetical protein
MTASSLELLLARSSDSTRRRSSRGFAAGEDGERESHLLVNQRGSPGSLGPLSEQVPQPLGRDRRKSDDCVERAVELVPTCQSAEIQASRRLVGYRNEEVHVRNIEDPLDITKELPHALRLLHLAELVDGDDHTTGDPTRMLGKRAEIVHQRADARRRSTSSCSLDRRHLAATPRAASAPTSDASRSVAVERARARTSAASFSSSARGLIDFMIVIHEEAGLCQGHGLRGVGRLAVGGGSACGGRVPVIHPAARGGPECRSGLGGSIKWAAVLEVARPDNHASSPEGCEVVVRAGACWRQRISPSRRP